jgi:hypothetical protein
MNNTRKVALSAVAAWGLAVSAHAGYVNGDLLAGFTGGIGTPDFILDLGPFSSLTVGETWNVGANLGTQFGVVGALNLGQLVFATSSSSTENSFNPTGLFTAARAGVATLAQGSLTVGTSATLSPSLTYSWAYQTAQAAGTPGNTFENNFFNPNVSVGATAYFFGNANNGTVAAEDVFTYNSAAGTLSYQLVPEPGTVSLLALFSVLGLVVRRRLAGKSR